MRVIQAFAQEDTTTERFQEVNRANRDANIRAMQLSFFFMPVVQFLGIVATAIVLYFGGKAVAREVLTLGIVVSFLASVTLLPAVVVTFKPRFIWGKRNEDRR